jgi:xanthine dehydrogenase accessory factor
LKEKGVRKEILESIYAPIGIDINSETPQEIAISIVAQLIKVRGLRN